MLAWSSAAPPLLVVIVPMLVLVPLRTSAALYVVEGLPSWNPSSTLTKENGAVSVTTAVPEDANLYPVSKDRNFELSSFSC